MLSFEAQLSLWSNSHLYMINGKTIALTKRTFVGKIIFLLFNMLSRLIIAFLPGSKHLLISWLQSPSAVILEAKKMSLSNIGLKFSLLDSLFLILISGWCQVHNTNWEFFPPNHFYARNGINFTLDSSLQVVEFSSKTILTSRYLLETLKLYLKSFNFLNFNFFNGYRTIHYIFHLGWVLVVYDIGLFLSCCQSYKDIVVPSIR